MKVTEDLVHDALYTLPCNDILNGDISKPVSESEMRRALEYAFNSYLQNQCKNAVGKQVMYRGTNGDEYSPRHGKRLEGKGECVEWHNSHGLCIIVVAENGERLCVDPEEVFIIG